MINYNLYHDSDITLAAALQILTDARAILADPGHWTKGAIARTADGLTCKINAPWAERFCALGALNLAAWRLELGSSPFSIAQNFLAACLDDSWHFGFTTNKLAGFNDAPGTQHAEVLQLFDSAIGQFIRNYPAITPH